MILNNEMEDADIISKRGNVCFNKAKLTAFAECFEVPRKNDHCRLSATVL